MCRCRSSPIGHVYWLQPVLTTPKGTHWGPTQATTADFAVLERKPANLTVSLDKNKELTTKVENRISRMTSLGRKSSRFSEVTTTELLEVIQPPIAKDGKKSAEVKTAYISPVGYRMSRDGRSVKMDRNFTDALNVVRGWPPTFVIDDSNATAGYRKVSINANHPKYKLKDLIEDFNECVNNPFEATRFKMPNRMVQPQDTFESQSTMMMSLGGQSAKTKTPQRQILDLKIKCTLEGVRVRNGKEEAVISIVGTLEPRKSKGRTLGDITGKFAFDTSGGFVSWAKVKLYAAIEESISGLGTYRESISQEFDLDRVAGNPRNVVVAPPNVGPGPGPNPNSPPPPDPTKPIPSPAKGKTLLNRDDKLAANDPIDPVTKGHMKVFPGNMKAGVAYVISMNSTAFDTYLRLEDPDGKEVAKDDDSGGALNARIIYTPTQAGVFRIVATSFRPEAVGAFKLVVEELNGPNGRNPKDVPKEIPKGWRHRQPGPQSVLQRRCHPRHLTFQKAGKKIMGDIAWARQQVVLHALRRRHDPTSRSRFRANYPVRRARPHRQLSRHVRRRLARRHARCKRIVGDRSQQAG